MSCEVQAHKTVESYFRCQVKKACFNQNVEPSDHVEFYLVHLLSEFAQSSIAYASSEPEIKEAPLAILFLKSLSIKEAEKQIRFLKRLGDFSLFTSGYFSDSLNRKIVDLDYYIAMGSSAYQMLSGLHRDETIFGEVFEELSKQFSIYVDILSEISENAGLQKNSDILRLYEKYLKTGSFRLKEKLSEAGIELPDINPMGNIH